MTHNRFNLYYRISAPDEELTAYVKVEDKHNLRLMASERPGHKLGNGRKAPAVKELEEYAFEVPAGHAQIPAIVKTAFRNARIRQVQLNVQPNFWKKNEDVWDEYTLYVPQRMSGEGIKIISSPTGRGKTAAILQLLVRLGGAPYDISREVSEAFQEAYQQSLLTKIPVKKVENDQLIEVNPDGSKRVIKSLPPRKKSMNRVFDFP
jgi:hypothetical protein